MSSRSAQAHKNINVIQRHVNWRQMELFFSVRAEGRENKLPFSLVANRERKSLSGRGNCTVCWKTSSACFLLLCCLLFTILFLFCSITSASLWENVSLPMWACAIEGVIRDPSTITVAGSVSTAALTSLAFCPTSICMSAGTQARLGQSTCVTSGFPFTILPYLLATYCRKWDCGQPPWPWVSYPLPAGLDELVCFDAR